MSEPTVVTGEVVEATPGPSFKDLLARYAKMQAFAQALDQYVKDEKAEVFRAMCEKADEDGTKSFNVLVDGESVAGATITETKDKVTVQDAEALLDYVLNNYPSEVETKPVVREAFEKVLLKKVKVQDITPEPTEDEPEPETVLIIVDPDTGEEVPGLKFVQGGEATTFSVRWKSQDRKDEVLQSLLAEVGGPLGIEAGEQS